MIAVLWLVLMLVAIVALSAAEDRHNHRRWKP